MKVILATHNQGKIREFQKRFSEIGWEVIPISDIADIPEPEETGTTFRENALQKARYYAEAVNLPVLSDDSGIIADVLGNEPGVYSARYAGVHGNDEANNQKLVEVLHPYRGNLPSIRPHDSNHAHIVSPACFSAIRMQNFHQFLIIRDFYKGTGGFGYDPLFYLPEFGKTMAELSMEEKNKISHRGKAVDAMLKKLKEAGI